MLYILAADMVMSPAGFRGKHYSDSLDLYPGWILLFRDKAKIPDDAVKHATFERKHLLPCIVSFDLSALSGPVLMLSRDGVTREVSSVSARKRKDDVAILLPAPLPTTLISTINFRSFDEKESFERAAYDVANVDLSIHKLVFSPSLFDTDTDVELAHAQQQQQQRFAYGNYPPFGQSLGGALAMLYHIANRSDLGLAAFRLVTGRTSEEDDDVLQSDTILAELPSWIKAGEISGNADTRARLFWGVVQSISSVQSQESRQTPVDIALAYLENQLDVVRDMEVGPRLERLIGDMRGCLGLGGGTITELLDRHKGSLSRPLLLFCLRETCTELLEFSHPLLSDAEYILSGILFGVRDGWLKFPRKLRYPQLSAYVSYRMADAEHCNHGASFAVNKPPPPKPLREFFITFSGECSTQQRRFALELARKCQWNDCIQTRITLAEGDYPDSFRRNVLQVILPGMVMVVEEVDMDGFLRRLGQWPPIPSQIEADLRKSLMNAQHN